MGCVSCPSDNNLYCMGEVPVIWWGQSDSKLRRGRPASLLPRTTGTLKGVLHTEAMGPVLMKADLQLSHYTTGREGRGVTKVTSSTGFKYCNSKIHFFVFRRRGARHDKGNSLLVTSFLRALCSCSTAAKPIEEQKNDESPERLPQAKVPLRVSPSAAKG